jgi:putative ABC transport system substrate-binding protein
MIGRRDFIAGLGGTAAWPFAARAQQGDRMRRIGVLSFGEEADSPFLPPMRKELQKLGWTEGRNLQVEFRGGGDRDRIRDGAADLVRLAPDVIVAIAGAALVAVQQETKSIPIVFLGAGDPAETGTVKNSARPEGNATGFANAFGSLGGKWLQLLKEAAPNIKRVAFLGGTSNYVSSIEAAARQLELQLV